jgi:hypothetical protein
MLPPPSRTNVAPAASIAKLHHLYVDCSYKSDVLFWDMAAKPINVQLGEVLKHLQLIQSAVVVAVAALRQQNCELDADISNVLQRSVADRIQDQIDRLETLSAPRGRL